MEVGYYGSLFAAFLTASMAAISISLIRANYRARIYFAFMISLFIYTFAAAQSNAAFRYEEILFWTKVYYLGAASLISILVMFAMHFCLLRENDRIPLRYYLLFVPGLFSMVGAWSFPNVTLFISSIETAIIDGRPTFWVVPDRPISIIRVLFFQASSFPAFVCVDLFSSSKGKTEICFSDLVARGNGADERVYSLPARRLPQ